MENLREQVAGLFMVECKDCLHGQNLKDDCPHYDEDICMWQRELANRAINLFKAEGYLSPEEAKKLSDERVRSVVSKVVAVYKKRFKQRVNKLTVIDAVLIDKGIVKAQLQHTKEQLLDLMGE